MASQSFDPAAYPIVLYDGQCLICDGFVRWIIRRDKKKIFKFSGLGSDKAEYEIIRRQIPMPKNGTVILLHRDIFQMESDAVISILKMMGLSSFLITFIQIFPKKWRDKIYGWIALHRYRIFKKGIIAPCPVRRKLRGLCEEASVPGIKFVILETRLFFVRSKKLKRV